MKAVSVFHKTESFAELKVLPIILKEAFSDIFTQVSEANAIRARTSPDTVLFLTETPAREPFVEEKIIASFFFVSSVSVDRRLISNVLYSMFIITFSADCSTTLIGLVALKVLFLMVSLQAEPLYQPKS